MNAFYLAPWVVKVGEVLLGTKLKAVKPTHLHFSQIPIDKLNYLLDNHFIITKKNLPGNANNLPISDISYPHPTNWIWIDDEFIHPAILLKNELTSLAPHLHWGITNQKNVILENLNIQTLNNPLIIRLSHHEPISKEAQKEYCCGLTNKARIVWIGETLEGTHIGPLISSESDLNNYNQATKNWYFSKKLIEAGFCDYWPLPIYLHLLSNSVEVAKSILQVIQSAPGTCYLISEKKTVSLWTTLLEHQMSETDLFYQQFWSKGLIRSLQMTVVEPSLGACIAICRTPCDAIEHLEVSGGKGENFNKTTYSLVGESIERFSAWLFNKRLENHSCHIQKSSIIYNINQFHPYGPKWDFYLKNSKNEISLYPVRDELNPGAEVFVPECLIPFPYHSKSTQPEITTSFTSGLAAHSNYIKAVVKGSLELFERNDFYTSFLFQVPGYILDLSYVANNSLADNSLEDGSIISKLLSYLKSNLLNYWFIIYHPESRIPIIHCFIEDQHKGFISRGSGSGHSLSEAILGCLLEALQIRQQFIKKLENKIWKEGDSWTNKTIIAQILNYLNQCPSLDISDHPLACVKYTSAELFDEIKETLGTLKKPLLVADLPCPIQGWFAVRVLIPGFSVHQYPSLSEGGRRLLNPIFKHAVPT